MKSDSKQVQGEKFLGVDIESPDLDNWPGEPPVIADNEITETVHTEIVIAGGGHAGLHCSLAAAECGVSVVVIEKRPEKEMTWHGEQIGTFNSKFLTERGFGGYDEDEIIEEFCKCGNYYVNRALIAKYVHNSGEALDHLLALVPPDSTLLDPDQCNVHCALPGTKYPIIRGGYKTWAGTLQFRGPLITTRGVSYRVNQFSRLPELLKYALKESQRLGVDWRFGHRTEVLITNGSRVIGIIAKDADGRYVKFLASRGTVLTLGNLTYKGHQLGIWAGGHMDNTPYERVERRVRNPSFAFGAAGFVQLNNDGKRFYNECVPYGNSYSYQPTGILSWVSDSNWLEYIKRSGLQHFNADFGMPAFIEQCQEDMSHVVESGKDGYEVRNCALTERETARVYGAETLEELAVFLGYEGKRKDKFLKSIERYNALCHKKHDDDFGRDVDMLLPIDSPPFYGGYSINPPCDWKSKPRYAGRLTGLHTDNDMCVVDKDCNPIGGLYAAGNNMGYLRSVFYATPCGGNAIGMAMTLGRVLGKHLASK